MSGQMFSKTPTSSISFVTAPVDTKSQHFQQQPPFNTTGRDPNIQYNIEHVFNDEQGNEVRKMPVMINNSTVWVDVVTDHNDTFDGEILELDASSQPAIAKPSPQ